MTSIKKHLTPVLFAVAYAAFMSVSIPKVGAIFLLYGDSHSPVWIAASYGAAITIDTLIGFLTYATTSKKRDPATQVGIWLFVLIFAGYSVYLNWIYDELHLPAATGIWLLPSPLPGWNVEQLTTVLVSAIPLGILAFTLIARLIRAESPSLEALRHEASEASERLALQGEIDAMRLGQRTSWVKSRIAAGKEMLHAVVSSDVVEAVENDQSSPSSQTETVHALYQQSAEQPSIAEQNTDVLAVVFAEEKEQETEQLLPLGSPTELGTVAYSPDTMALDTTVAIIAPNDSHRAIIKATWLRYLAQERAINLKDIALDAQVGYSTVKKWAGSIREEIEQERHIANGHH